LSLEFSIDIILPAPL